jgi:hypothetical protein
MIDISSMNDAKMCELCNRCVKGIFKRGTWVPLPSTTVKYGGYFCGYTCSNNFKKLKEIEEAEILLMSLNK